MPFIAKDFPSAKELKRVCDEHVFYQFYKSEILDPLGSSDRAKFRLQQFFENDTKKAKILDISLNIAPVVVDAGTDFTFGKLPKIQVDDGFAEQETIQAKIDEFVTRNNLLEKMRDSSMLFQTVGHTHFKLYAKENLAFIDEVPYHYWFPNWDGVPVGRDPNNIRIVAYLSKYDDLIEKKYIYIEDYYLESGKLLIGKSLWEDSGAKIGTQVALTLMPSITLATGAVPDPLRPLTMVEKTELDFLPFVSVYVRKNVMEREAESVLKKVLPLLYEVNDRLTQISVQFLKHLNAKLQVPDGSVVKDKDGKVKAVNLEVFLARQGEEAKYITNENPLIEQAFVHLEKVIRKIAKLTQTPDTFLTEDDKGGVEKAEALKTRLFLFVSRIERYQQIYQQSHIDAVRKGLTIEGVQDVDTIPLKVLFESSLPKDWETDATVWGEAKSMGLASRETAVGRFQNIDGDELVQELERIDEEDQKMMMTAMQNAANVDPNNPDNPVPAA